MLKAVVVCVLLSGLSVFAGGYYLFTSFVDTSGIDTVWQQVAGGTAATAFFALAAGFLLAALVMMVFAMLREVEALRLIAISSPEYVKSGGRS